ncbi:hypothetical protein [Candidatus Nitrosocosmicus arcticus]|uniref:hypothetical protein n=1 Tax=Candidatus Nitrosocosmicus arcticus TaxID=2035267 RepID=UPI0011A3E368|nr:hypothetical protein [Candidatus Nitrosocosmicus arcticus]
MTKAQKEGSMKVVTAFVILMVFSSIAYSQTALAFSLDSIKIKDLHNLPGFNILKEFKGEAGSNKEFDTIAVYNNVTFAGNPADPIHTLEVSCPQDTKVTGGGFDYNPKGKFDDQNQYGDVKVHESSPANNGWRITIDLIERNIFPVEVSVVATCGKLVDPL